MTADHYATLGVSPTASPADIRAAYLALMRLYHPDRNASPAAIERAQAIIAAFKLLSDFDRRNHYDWDRRRAREAAAATVAKRPRRVGAGAVATGVIGLAAVGTLAWLPPSTPEPWPIAPRVADARQPVMTTARRVPAPEALTPAVAKAEPPRPAALASPMTPAPAATIEPARVVKIDPIRRGPAEAAPAPVAIRSTALGAPAPRMAAVPPPPRQARVAAKPLPQASKNTTDLASLDQFVMSFYGQSWRFGDRPRRAVLEQTRASFVARRGACTADPCKRAAYLELMRDVSEIVEGGQPKTR